MPTLPAKLMRTLALGFVLVLCGNVVADQLRIKYYLPAIRGTAVRIHAYLQVGEPADVLVMGSSRSVQGVIPRVVEEELHLLTGEQQRVYNLAIAGARIGSTAVILRDAVAACGCPEVVLLELAPRTLDQGQAEVFDDLEYFASLPDTVRALPFIRTTDAFDAAGWGLLRGHLNIVLWVVHRQWLEHRRSYLADWVARGGSPYTYPQLGPEKRAIASWSPGKRSRRLLMTPLGRRSPEDPDIEYGRFTIGALDATLSLARDCGSQVVVWTPPAPPDFAALYRASESERFDALLADLAGLQGVVVLDLNPAAVGIDDGDFADFTHLNSRGAVKLSRALARSVAGQYGASRPAASQ